MSAPEPLTLNLGDSSAIILIGGPKTSGKSWLINELFKLSQDFWEVSFAEPIKQALTIIYGHEEYFRDPELKELKHPNSPHTGRKLMQDLGTFMRSLDEDVFVKAAIREMQRRLEYCSNFDFPLIYTEPPNFRILVPDARYPNEVQRLQEAFPTVPIIVLSLTADVERTDGHSSEQGLPKELVDCYIYNDRQTNQALICAVDAIELLVRDFNLSNVAKP